MTWSHFEVEELVQRVLKKERDQIDALLAKRMEECLCAPPVDNSGVPCDACMEVARIKGELIARRIQLQDGPG